MSRTIDLATEIKKLESLAADRGDLTPEMIADTLEGLEGMTEDKFDSTMNVIRDFEAKAEKCKKEAARISERKRHWERQVEALRKYLLQCLIAMDRTSFKTTLNTFSMRNGKTKLVIDNVDLLPDQFVESHTEVVTIPREEEIKKSLQAATEKIAELKKEDQDIPDTLLNAVPGAHLEVGSVSLQVR